MVNKKKIYFIDHAPYEGGAEVVVIRLLHRLPADEFEFHIIMPRNASWRSKVPSWVKVHEFSFDWTNYGKLIPLMKDMTRMYRLLVNEKPDIIHTHSSVSTILLGMLRVLFNITRSLSSTIFISHIHDINNPSAWKWWLIKRLDHFIVVSNWVKEVLIEEGISEAYISVITNGVDIQQFTQPEIMEKEQSVLFVGQIVPHKGLKLLIKAFAKVKNKYPNATLNIVGEDSSTDHRYEREYKLLVNSLSLYDSAIFYGFKDDVVPCFLENSICCVPSLEEAFGLVAIEAMAAGKPVIASDVGGLGDIVINDETGILVEPGNVNQLAEALNRLLADSHMRKQMGEKGRERVKEKYSIEVQVEKVSELYRSVIA